MAFYFPPAGGGGVQRPLKFATHLPEFGVETHVLAPTDPKWVHRDDSLRLPPDAIVHRVGFIGPRGRKPAEELHGTRGLRRLRRSSTLLFRRLLAPDEAVTWVLTAIPAAVRVVRAESIDVVVTTSPPGSNHLVGAAVKALTGIRWVADLRDPLVAHPHRDIQRRSVRAKEKTQAFVAWLVARYADGVACVSEAIADETTRRMPRGPVVVVPNGADFDDFANLPYRPGRSFRITHTGSFFGRRDPKPFLSALARADGMEARFVGDFRAADHEWLALQAPLAGRVEIIPFVSRRLALELQRDSEALLLLIPDSDGRGRQILSGKVFEYLAAERPVLALVPPDGAAAELLRRFDAGPIVPPDDIDAIVEALRGLLESSRAGTLTGPQLTDRDRMSISRRTHVARFADLLREVS